MDAADRHRCAAARDLERFMRCELPGAEAAAIVGHLLTGCPQCIRVTRQFWDLADPPYALRVLLEEGLASQAFVLRIRLGRREEP